VSAKIDIQQKHSSNPQRFSFHFNSIAYSLPPLSIEKQCLVRLEVCCAGVSIEYGSTPDIISGIEALHS